MTIITIHYKKFKGQHYIFDSITEAVKILTEYPDLNTNKQSLKGLNPFLNWYDPLVNELDWVLSDDGKVIQILRKWKFEKKNKDGELMRYKNGNPYYTISIKVACGVYSAHTLKDGTIQIAYRMLPYHAPSVKSSITHNKTVAGKYLTNAKRKFAFELAVTADPILAAQRVMKPKNGGTVSKKSINVFAFTLVQDELVIKEVLKYTNMTDFKTKLKEKLTDKNLDVDRAVSELESGLDNAKKGSSAHLAWVQLMFQLNKYAEDGQTPAALAIGGAKEKEQLEEPEQGTPSYQLEAPKEDISISPELAEEISRSKTPIILKKGDVSVTNNI